MTPRTLWTNWTGKCSTADRSASKWLVTPDPTETLAAIGEVGEEEEEATTVGGATGIGIVLGRGLDPGLDLATGGGDLGLKIVGEGRLENGQGVRRTDLRAPRMGPRALESAPRALKSVLRALRSAPRALEIGLRVPRIVPKAPRRIGPSPEVDPFPVQDLAPLPRVAVDDDRARGSFYFFISRTFFSLTLYSKSVWVLGGAERYNSRFLLLRTLTYCESILRVLFCTYAFS